MSGVNIYGPAGPPPHGVTPNYDHPENKAALGYGVVISCLICVTFFAWFRFFVKLCIVRTLHIEDYMIPVAWAAAVAHITSALLNFSIAPIVHSWDITLDNFLRYAQTAQIGAIFYNISIFLIKLSMLIQILRIFVPSPRSFSVSKTSTIVHVLIGTNFAFYASTITAQIIAATQSPWHDRINVPVVAMCTAIFNLLSDVAILAVSQRTIWKIKVPGFSKRRLSAVFMAGVAPCLFSIVCLHYSIRELHSSDIMLDATYMGLACYAEIASGMFVLFLPVLPRFLSAIKLGDKFEAFWRSRGTTDGSAASTEAGVADVEKGVMSRLDQGVGANVERSVSAKHKGDDFGSLKSSVFEWDDEKR